MAERVRVREITDEEGQRLLRILRRSTGSVVTWRRAQMVLLSAQGMPVPKIAEVTFTSSDRVRDVIHNFNADGFDALYRATAAAAHLASRWRSGARSSRWRCPARPTTGGHSRPGA